jgi:hypothetical protein
MHCEASVRLSEYVAKKLIVKSQNGAIYCDDLTLQIHISP